MDDRRWCSRGSGACQFRRDCICHNPPEDRLRQGGELPDGLERSRGSRVLVARGGEGGSSVCLHDPRAGRAPQGRRQHNGEETGLRAPADEGSGCVRADGSRGGASGSVTSPERSRPDLLRSDRSLRPRGPASRSAPNLRAQLSVWAIVRRRAICDPKLWLGHAWYPLPSALSLAESARPNPGACGFRNGEPLSPEILNRPSVRPPQSGMMLAARQGRCDTGRRGARRRPDVDKAALMRARRAQCRRAAAFVSSARVPPCPSEARRVVALSELGRGETRVYIPDDTLHAVSVPSCPLEPGLRVPRQDGQAQGEQQEGHGDPHSGRDRRPPTRRTLHRKRARRAERTGPGGPPAERPQHERKRCLRLGPRCRPETREAPGNARAPPGTSTLATRGSRQSAQGPRSPGGPSTSTRHRAPRGRSPSRRA